MVLWGQEIGAEYRVYAKMNELVTVPYALPVGCSKISLEVDEELPEGTDVEYFIAFANDKKALKKDSGLYWHPISPLNRQNPVADQVIDLSTTSSSIKVFHGSQASHAKRENGVDFHVIDPKIGSNYLHSSINLHVGYNQWKIQGFVNESIANVEPDHMPIPSDYYDIQSDSQITNITERFVDANGRLLSFDGLPTAKGAFYKYTIHFKCSNYVDLTFPGLSYDAKKLSFALYLNGKSR